MRMLVTALALATLLAACGGAGAGGSTPPGAKTTAPVVAGTEAPKEYNPGKTASPSSSPDDYYGY
jgi:ABC-type glycerol-3-phosphate transport system substrate-binding protein